MITTWKEMLETKKFWYAMLTLIAAIGGHWGLKLDINNTLLLMAPFAALLGAQGWADSGPGGAVVAQARLLRRAQLASTTPEDRNALMKIAGAALVLMVAGIFVISSLSSCGATGAQIKQNGLACAGKQVSASLLEQVAVDLFSKNFTDLEGLAVTNGLAFVNCLVTTTVATHATPPETGSGAVKVAAPSPIVVNGNEWLSTHPTTSVSGGAQ